MTTNEILSADLIDIVFDKRNKEYGAYVLRKKYSLRLLTALSAGIFLAGLFVLAVLAGTNKKRPAASVLPRNEGIVIRTVELPRMEIKAQEPPVKTEKIAAKKKTVPVATIRFTTPPRIKKDKEVSQPMPEQPALEHAQIGTVTTEGKPSDGTVETAATQSGTAPEEPVMNAPVQPEFRSEEKAPLFPGGPEALKQFMARNLGSPGSLETGEKVLVQVRFVVNKDGGVSGFEIIKSGGAEYDREVVRVCRKMPRWIPASQNGIPVPVNYVLPVTFIGTEG